MFVVDVGSEVTTTVFVGPASLLLCFCFFFFFFLVEELYGFSKLGGG